MKTTTGRKFVSVMLALLLISTGLAPIGLTPIKAAEYDLTTDTSVQQLAIEGAIWTKLASSDPTGSGIFESFLRVQKNGVEKGYNTDYRPIQFDQNSSAQFTRSFKLADVPQVRIGETIYREFQLDINQGSSDPEWYISLDKFQVWLTDDPNLHGYDTSTWGFPSGAVKVYDLGDNSIKLDFRMNPGSGKRDYRVLVPESMFAGKTGEYVVLFTQHGATYEANDGFEEWGVAIKNALIEGYKWNDMNGNGVWDEGEPGLNDWTINLSGAVSTSTLTHNDDSGKAGYYSFSVAPGSYIVSEVEQAGWMQTYPMGDSYSVTAGNGAVITGLNFGNMQPLPGISVTKTGDQLSKAGDEVTYTVEIENTGNVALAVDSVIDTLKGDITSNFTSPLGVGGSTSYSYTYTVPNGAADPLLNEVAVNAHMVDHAEIATSGSSSHSVELFQPSFEVTKSGPSVVMIGSTVTYTYTIKNNSSADSPKLVLEAINDNVLGDLSSYAPANLIPGEEVTFTADYRVTVAGTLTNVVTATYGVEGFPNKLVGSDDHTLFVADPKLKVTKTGDQLSKAGDEVTYTVEIENTGNVALAVDSVIDTLKGDITSNFTSPLGVGGSTSYSYTYTVPNGAADPLLNEVAVNAHMVDHAEIATSGSSSHSVELFQPSFEVTKSGPSVVMIGSTVTYTYTIKNNSSADSPKLVLEAINDNVLGDLSSYAPANLIPGEEVTFTADYRVTVAGTLTNVVTATYGVEGFPNKLVGSDDHTLFVADPNTVVTATAYTWETYPGGNVSVTITERNTGNIDLENVSVSVFDGINTAVLDCHSVGFSGDDGNCILNKGEMWSWAYQVTVYADTTYVVTGYGEVVGLEGVVVTYPAYPSEQTTFKVKVVGTTRTQGFWQTHTAFTEYVFKNYAGSYIDLGWKEITNIEDLMGMFWANNAKKSDGTKRSQLDQARMMASQQAIAAVLNSSMPGGAPLPGGLTPAAIATIMGGTDVKAIKALGSTLGSYNESGDGFALDPSLLPTGKATPNLSRQIANIPFAD